MYTVRLTISRDDGTPVELLQLSRLKLSHVARLLTHLTRANYPIDELTEEEFIDFYRR